MLPKEIFKNIRRIEITTKRLVTDVFAGQYHSVFKGQGIEFDEVREYQIGDDVRTIDWNVTARTGRPHVKKFVEERELTVMLCVDVSRSCQFGSVNYLKSQLAAEISSLIALSASKNNDKVGALLFTDRIEKFIPPRKGMKHILRSIREILYHESKGQGTNIIEALDYLSHVIHRRTITFVISDFLNTDSNQSTDALRKSLSAANKRHDIIAITLNDPRELTLPQSSILHLHDAETGEKMMIDASNKKLRNEYSNMNIKRIEERKKLFKRCGIDSVDISTDSSYVDQMIKFFKRRQKLR